MWNSIYFQFILKKIHYSHLQMKINDYIICNQEIILDSTYHKVVERMET